MMQFAGMLHQQRMDKNPPLLQSALDRRELLLRLVAGIQFGKPCSDMIPQLALCIFAHPKLVIWLLSEIGTGTPLRCPSPKGLNR